MHLISDFPLIIKMSKANGDSNIDIPLTDNIRTLELEELFDQVDSDRDGRVSYVELWRYLQYREDNHNIPRHVIRRIHEKADRNDDGGLQCREFVKMVTDPENKYYFGQYMNKYMNILLPPQSVTSSDGVRRRSTQDYQFDKRWSCWPPQVSMVLISLIAIVIYTIQAVEGKTTGSSFMGKMLIYNPHRRKEAWRYVSYMFIHDGLFHLSVNVLFQLMLGIPLEMAHKWWRVLIVYFCGVLAGSLGTSVMDPGVYLAGASGGVYSLLTAHIASIIMNWKDMKYAKVQMGVILVLIFADVWTYITNRYSGELDEQIGYAAHFFGALAGLLIGITVLKNVEITKREKKIRWGAWTLYLILMTTAVVINIVSPKFPEQYV